MEAWAGRPAGGQPKGKRAGDLPLALVLGERERAIAPICKAHLPKGVT